MSKYPVEIGDDEGVNDALNYLLSGPGGLGQNFKGFSSYAPTYVTGNFRPSYTTGSVTTNCTGVFGEYTITATSVVGLSVNMIVNGAGIAPNSIITDITGDVITLNNSNLADIDNLIYFTNLQNIYIPEIALGVSEMLDGNTWKFNFLTPQSAPPFNVGNNISVIDVVDGSQSISTYTISGTKASSVSTQTYSGLTPTGGSGTGFTVDVELAAGLSAAYDETVNTTITVQDSGTGYLVGDVLTIPGSLLGGVDVINDLLFTVVHTSSYYDGDYSPIGVVECTTTYVIARTDGTYTVVPPAYGGFVYYYNTRNNRSSPLLLGTDCNAKVVITGGTDRIFISAQLNNIIKFTDTVPCNFNYTVSLDRYKGFITTDPVNPDYRFQFDETVSRQIYNYYDLVSSVNDTLDNVETIFTNVIDSPSPGYYWYILDVAFNGLQSGESSSDLQVVSSQLGVRSLSAIVVKQ